MVSFENFRAEGHDPVYLQIIYYIKRGAVSGVILDGDEIPSRRVVSALLGINPNTVQKAFRMLEEEGLIESRTGARSYMKLDAKKLEVLRSDLLSEDLRRMTDALKSSGVSKDEALRLIAEQWDKEDTGR